MPVRHHPASHRVIAALNNPTFVARGNPGFFQTLFSGGFNIVAENIPLTKKQRHAHAIKQETLYRNRYLECKQASMLKGKGIYPDDPKGACKTKWKGWQKWRGKAGENALKVAEAAEKKGRLDPMAAAALQADAARAMAEDPNVTMQMAQQLPPEQQDAYLEETLSANKIPWLWLGGAAAVGTLGLIFILRR